jgi:hypothetical protein
MPTQEDRIPELERKVTTLELKRLYDERKAAENTPDAQAYNHTEINHNLTMLLGIASGQEHAIRLMQGDLGIIKERMEFLDQRIDGIDGRLDGIERSLEGVDGRLDGIERALHHLATLITKSE